MKKQKRLYPDGTKIKLPKTKCGQTPCGNVYNRAVSSGMDYLYYYLFEHQQHCLGDKLDLDAPCGDFYYEDEIIPYDQPDIKKSKQITKSLILKMMGATAIRFNLDQVSGNDKTFAEVAEEVYNEYMKS